MRVFVTGATGLIGAGVARALRARGHRVVTPRAVAEAAGPSVEHDIEFGSYRRLLPA